MPKQSLMVGGHGVVRVAAPVPEDEVALLVERLYQLADDVALLLADAGDDARWLALDSALDDLTRARVVLAEVGGHCR